MSRIWDSSKDLVVSADMTAGSLQESRSQDLPMLLLVRMVTRIMPKKFDEEENVKEESMEVDGPPEERLRHVLFDYILTNFPARLAFLLTKGFMHLFLFLLSRERLALAWMNEEWFNDRLRRTEDPDWVSPRCFDRVVTVLPDSSDQTTSSGLKTSFRRMSL